MSEYQYYEFVAIDRPLTQKQMAALRARSTRATITATSFVNDYEWGDLKADPNDWMKRYFDAFVYTANWCSCRLSLRVPQETFTKSMLKSFKIKYSLTIDETPDYWVINWWLDESENYDRFAIEDGQGWMGRLTPIRDELLRGDLCSLYLGWLAAASADQVSDNALEPEVPAGLSQLSAAQQALVEFLEIDVDWVEAAAMGSAPLAKSNKNTDASMDAWLTARPTEEMRAVIKLLLENKSQQAEREIKSRFLAWQKQSSPAAESAAKKRSVSELHSLAMDAEKRRQQRESIARAKQAEQRHAKREAYLKSLAADFDRSWNAAHLRAEHGTAAAYDDTKLAIADLNEAYALISNKQDFEPALRLFMEHHIQRGALVRRLIEAGLWKK